MSETNHVTIGVTGMTCAACSSRVEKVLNKMDGVEAQVNLTTEKATIDYNPEKTSIEHITNKIENVGYGVLMEKTDLDVFGMTCAACSSGHAPVSNMFEFLTFLGMALVLGFIIIYLYYKLSFLGLFALPIAMIIIAYGSMFSTEVAPLVPSLQSHWLYIHVTTVGIGQGILGISFVVGLMYLIKRIDQSVKSKQRTWLEFVLYLLFVVIGFIVITTTFNAMNYNATFEYESGTQTLITEYHLPAIAAPNEGTLLTEEVMQPWFETPAWFHGADAGRKFNTLIWSIIVGTALYIITRIILRKRVGAAVQPMLKNVNADLLDEIQYRSVAIGFPVFTLGGLIFASIWAEVAWGRFWGWDPKEVWALVTWFFYAAYLHLRLSRGWHGEKSAWLAVIGFGIIMFNLIVVNLVIAGLHSYA